VISTAAVAQTTSPNLVPLPNHWTTNGQSVVQSYAINQALALSGSDVRINGFDYGYQYNLGSSWTQCTWVNNGVCVQTQTYNPRVDVNVSIRDSANAQIYGTTHIETGVNTGNVSRHYELRFADPRDMLTLGNFNYTASTSTNATVFGMYSRAVYTIVDPCVSNPQSSPACPGYKTYYNMWDDGYAQVNLPFAFPFYGQTFTTSYMFTNGVVGFLNTNLWGYCCDGTDLNQQAVNGNTSWNFAIYALNTDLYPGQNSRFYTQQTDGGTGLKYTWENVVEIGTNYENTFSVNIKDTGYIGINYEKVNLSAWRNPLIGIAGDVSQGQYSQYYFGQASGLPNLAGTTLTYTGTETTDICAINPLYNASCPGYQQAYFTQQCSINSLYDPSCPGYQQAYFTQQCSANQLYDVACPGYAQAYYDYQCNADPLYHTGCPGYQQAYFDQQCSADPLYNNQCSGYQQAYFDQQCGLDGLYSAQCPNYADAYYVQQCSISPLYDSGCTGYAEAYFSQQCGLDPLYNNQCPGYAEAYAKKNILNIGTTTPVVEESVIVTATESSTPQLISDPVANQAVTTITTSASPAQPVAPVQLVPAPQPVTTAATEEKKEDSKTESPASDSSATTTASTSENKDQPKSTRQALAERRLAAARAKAVEAGKELANKMGEAASMEAQVAVQNVVIQAMGFTPGFDAYNRAMLPDAQGYRPFEIYPGQRVIDNPQGRRFMTGSDRLHAEMIDQQYLRSE
jgi:hypothetical protein